MLEIASLFVGLYVFYLLYTRVYLVHQNLKFYEQQGAHILPSSYKWFIGCLNGVIQFEQEKSLGNVPGMLPDEYILDNVEKWSGQKGYVKEHHKLTIW